MTFSLGCKKYDYFTICWNTLKGLIQKTKLRLHARIEERTFNQFGASGGDDMCLDSRRSIKLPVVSIALHAVVIQ